MNSKHKVKRAFSACVGLAVCTGLVSPIPTEAAERTLPELKIQFNEPVSESQLSSLDSRAEEQNRWQQLSLPIGNSKMGANVYGEIGKERLTFNEKTLWNGGPSESRPDYNGGNKSTTSSGQNMADYLKAVKNAFLNGDSSAAAMCEQIVGEVSGYGSYQSFGDIYLDFDREGNEVEDFEIIDDRDERIQYGNGWNNYPQSSWTGGSEKYSYTDGASFLLEFEGVGIRMIGVQYNEMGVCDVYIDDMDTPLLTNVDMYSASKKEGVPLFEVNGLTNGTHTLKFVSKASSGRSKVSYDRLEVLKASSTQIVDLNPSNASTTGIEYSSDWGMWDRQANGESDAADWVNQDEMFSDHPNADTKISYTFEGTGIALYGAKHSPLGTLTWTIDGEITGDVNCYAPSMQRQELFHVYDLDEGTHTVVITSKDNTKLSLDNFVVYNGDSDPSQTVEHGPYTNYSRWLSLDDSLAGVEFDRDNTHYSREYLASNPDEVIAIHLEAEGERTLDFDLSFPISQPANTSLGKTVTTTTGDEGTLSVSGMMNDNQMKFAGYMQVVTDQGSVEALEDRLKIDGATDVVIYVSAATDYKNEYPTYRTGQSDEDVLASVQDKVENAVEKGYEQVKEDHLNDYHEIYDRVVLDLGQEGPQMATPDLLNRYNNNTADQSARRYLEVLTFQYGRYLLISSSRDNDSLPANLQGVWNIYNGDHNAVPWGSDYHMNVNLQMNYWLTYNTNMEECALPMIEYVNSLREPGRVTASTYFGIDNSDGQQNGYSAHTQNTPFGWTCPGWAFSWGWSPAAVPWMLQNVYEYYEYTMDVDYLRETIFPMMEEEAKLYEQILTPVTYANGVTRLVTVPAYSPEHGPYTAGNAYENELVWQLFNDCIEAAQALNADQPGSVDESRIEAWQEIKDQLQPIEIGASGQIKEWYDETTLGSVSGAQSNHRHLSHLLGLYPGDLITRDTPEYLEAAKVSLNARGDQSTGWAMAQRINAWARLKDGNRALSLINTLFKNGMFPNLWDAHPPFQIDGNFGYSAAVAEMLMQSNASSIELLPALPDQWSQGSVSGIKARGNFVIDASWQDGQILKATVTSNAGGTCVLDAPGLSNVQIVDERGQKVSSVEEDGTISFETEAGKTYVLDQNNQKQPEDDQQADKRLLLMAVQYAQNAQENGALEGVNELVANEFLEALEQAEQILFDVTATQEDVDASWTRLSKAIHMLNFHSDKTALGLLIEQAQDVDLSQLEIDDAIEEEFKAALEFAKEVYNDPTALDEQSIAEAIARLQAALDAVLQGQKIDTTMLAFLISQVENEDMQAYTPNTAKAFEETLAQAKAVLAAPNSQSEVDQMVNDLHQAWLELRKKPDEALLQELKTFLTESEAFDLFGDASLTQTLSELRADIQQALSNEELSQSEASALVERTRLFTQQVEQLQKPSSLEKEEKPEAVARSVNTVSTSTKTDASGWLWAMGVAAVVIIAGAVWYGVKKRKEKE